MIFIWTRSPKPGSRLIRWGLGHDCSHFSVCFNEERGPAAIVLESTLGAGASPIWLEAFRKKYEIVHALHAPVTGSEESELFWQLATRLSGRRYDTAAMAYWVWAGVKYRFFGQALPRQNAWGRAEQSYCVEVLEQMPEYLEEIEVSLAGIDIEMTSPHEAYILLKQSPYLTDIAL